MGQGERLPFGPHRVIAISYCLEDSDGAVLDVATLGEPLVFMFGSGRVLSGLEAGLVGKAAGDRFRVEVPPSVGFGAPGAQPVLTVPRAAVGRDVGLHMPFELEVEGERRIVTVTEMSADSVQLSADPPLAGVTLVVTGRVVAVRGSSSDEEVHGRALVEGWP